MFGSGFAPEGLGVPGDPEELFSLASQLRVAGEGLHGVADEIAAIGPDGWRGPAAEAFQGVLAEQPSQYREAGTAFLGAARSVSAYAEALASAQQIAARAMGIGGAAAGAARPGPPEWNGSALGAAIGIGTEDWPLWPLGAAHEDLAVAARAAVHALQAHQDVAPYGSSGGVALTHAGWAGAEQLQFAETPGEEPRDWSGWTSDPAWPVGDIVPGIAEARNR